jgi:hypothetical protein
MMRSPLTFGKNPPQPKRACPAEKQTVFPSPELAAEEDRMMFRMGRLLPLLPIGAKSFAEKALEAEQGAKRRVIIKSQEQGG